VKRKATLRIASSPQEAWAGAIAPWFREVLPVSWKQKLPSVVVVPTRSHAHALKARLLEERQSHLGIQFVTPAGLRELLGDNRDQGLPLREHLRLLLAVAAEETLRESAEDDASADNLAAKAVVRAPDHLLRTLDRLETAGWDFASLGLDSFQPIVRRFREQLRACGFSSVAQFDRDLLAQSAAKPPFFAHLLVCGFDAAHWSQWFLLRAAVHAAESATILLDYPRENSEIDLCWVGSWEEAFGEAKPLFQSPRQASGDALFSEAEMRGESAPTANCTFVVGADATEQAEAVLLLCVRFLSEENCARVGVVFGAAGSLSRLVASGLDRLDIPHHDGLAHLAPGPFESNEWRAWVELQRSPRIGSLLRFFNALPNAAELFPDITAYAMERRLRDAYAELLIDDLEVLREFCAGQTGDHGPLVAEVIRSLGLFPTRASLAEFLKRTEESCRLLGWNQLWWQLAARVDERVEKLSPEISRSLFLRWLDEVAFSFVPERGARGDHSYARVQLLTVPQASGQEWSHLVFAGWNEGSWPPPPHGEFMREDEIEVFNRTMRQLNRRASRQGRQGEGHESVREGHTLYLGPVEQRRIALRQFNALRESATGEIAVAASLIDESAPERLWNPNELFTQLYQEVEGRPLTERAMADLQKETRAWLAGERGLTNGGGAKMDVAQTGVAYRARRDPAAQAGEYDFAFRTKAPEVPTLSVSDFENLLAAPAIVWMKKYLGVKAPEQDASVWNTSTGRWIHDWLASIAGAAGKTFARCPNAAEIDRRILSAAREKRDLVARLCHSASRPLPDWWESGHRHALFLARILGEKLVTIDDWPWMATEWKIDDGLAVQLGDNAALSLRGRMDLLLARNPAENGSLAAEELWVIDYKTGAKKSLDSSTDDVEKRRAALRKRLLDGTALQLGLYALAAQNLGAQRTFISLASPLVRPLTPQLAGADIAMEQDIFAELARMQQSGQFGMHGPLRSAYRFTEDYPLATLAIDPDVLELRWEKTHPALVREDEDIFW
jgi:PD-(D/E)XK nuclease superfamily protein